MNAKDLMIGDWVSSRGKIEQVREVYDGYICTDSFEDSHDYHFEPIPLTPEILEKNGFKQIQINDDIQPDIYNCCLGEVYIEIGLYKPMFINVGYWHPTEKGGYLSETLSSFIKQDGGDYYVHELQHALKLCEIDKEINL